MMKVFIAVLFVAVAVSTTLAREYDIVIAGGGTAGCSAAAEFVDAGLSVLVIELGNDESDITSLQVQFYNSVNTVPGQFASLYSGNIYFADYIYSNETSMSGRSMVDPEANLLGGKSSINGDAFSRSVAAELVRWNMSGWTYNETLADWKKIEGCTGPYCNPAYHGVTGPVNVNTFNTSTTMNVIADAFIQTFNLTFHPDLNDGYSNEYGWFGQLPRNINASSGWPIRQDAWTRFLKPRLGASNLNILTGAMVFNVALKMNGKHQISYYYQGKSYTVIAKKEFINALGTIRGAQLFQLSGIGDCNYLGTLNVECQVNNTNVGKGLQDAILSSMVFGSPVLPPNPYPGSIYVGYYKSPIFTGQQTDMEVAFASLAPTGNVYLVEMSQLRHSGVGEVRLHSTNPFQKPLFWLNIYKNTTEAMAFVDLIKKIRTAMALSGLNMQEIKPGYSILPLGATDAQILSYVLGVSGNDYHMIGTCAMGKVVDARLRLIDENGHVIPGIRVMSLAAVPQLLQTHGTAAMAMLIGKVGARKVLEDHGFVH